MNSFHLLLVQLQYYIVHVFPIMMTVTYINGMCEGLCMCGGVNEDTIVPLG